MIKDLSRSSASRLTLATQAASAALAVGAVAIIVVGLPERQRPGTTLPVANTPGNPQDGGPGANQPGSPGSDETRGYRVDMGGLAARLGMLDNAPTVPEVKSPDTAVDVGEPAVDDGVPPQPFASRVRYLGMIRVGESAMAFVNIDGSQRVVRAGSVVPAMKDLPELGDLTITAIEPNTITVSHEDGQAEIALSKREGPAITLVAGGEVDRVQTEAPTEPSRFETNANGNPLPPAEIDRRRRAVERQRTQNPRDYDGPGLRMPEIRRAGSMGNRQPNREREPNEQNTGGDE